MPDNASHLRAHSTVARWRRWFLPALAIAGLSAAIGSWAARRAAGNLELRIAEPATAGHKRLVRALVEHAATRGVSLHVVAGANERACDVLRDGRADLCLVSGSPPPLPDVDEVLVLTRETAHLVVVPTLANAGIEGLRGRRVNLGPPTADWRAIVESIFAFAGMNPDSDFTATTYSAAELSKLAPAELPDAIVTVGEVCPPEVAPLVREHGYQPLVPPFLEALARTGGDFKVATLPPAVYGVDPPVPAKRIDALTVELRLVARHDASSEAVKALLGAMFEGDFAREAGLPFLDENTLGDDRRMRLHAGTKAFLHRHDPLLTPELVEETEDLRNLIAAVGFAGFVTWRWAPARSRAVMNALSDIHALEREGLRLETSDEVDAQALLQVRQKLAHVKRGLIEQVVSHERFRDPFLVELLQHIDAVRRALLEAATHRNHVQAQERLRESELRGSRPPLNAYAVGAKREVGSAT